MEKYYVDITQEGYSYHSITFTFEIGEEDKMYNLIRTMMDSTEKITFTIRKKAEEEEEDK